MNPGELDTPLVLERRVQAKDRGGAVVTRWDVLDALVWARVMPLSAREVQAQATTEVRLTHRLTVLYRSDVQLDGTMRFRRVAGTTPDVLATRVFNVLGGRNAFGAWELLELEVEEVEVPADPVAASGG